MLLCVWRVLRRWCSYVCWLIRCCWRPGFLWWGKLCCCVPFVGISIFRSIFRSTWLHGILLHFIWLFLSPNGVFTLAVRSFTLFPVLFASLISSCYLVKLRGEVGYVLYHYHSSHLFISLIFGCLFSFFIACSISLRSCLFSSNIYLMFLSSSLYHVGILFDDGSFRVVCVIWLLFDGVMMVFVLD